MWDLIVFLTSWSINQFSRNLHVLCIGDTGLGKSTMMDSLFNTTFDSQQSSTHTFPNVQLKPKTCELLESNVNLKLTIVETVGNGDQIDKDSNGK
ncbi:septin-2-like isoform X4 [Tachypleus tridentatus]|uniref:septin-2-like isoform X4 n=1 Tax=Tachypleus tridentatus TaxID=6853 RepID=UPI003FD1F019